MTKTKNENLQAQLESWSVAIAVAFSQPNPSAARTDAILDFVRTFVPSDVTEDDIDHFSNALSMDDEFFESTVREIAQCASGEKVETIEGDQKRKAVYTLLPPEGTVSEGSSLDIVRELAFISKDGGLTWRAEG
eukprot:CAMPEP_0184985392 /NCGR_PEP_ID=MMETSP1098-20130426/14091_1 /TAXON_ID=89044 /ORGANISM="Spumella elongata, Strain CCAP 955/1" /LENGTH=133 /DNA_ID=CAMNT_0027509477 /DNA_START=53 /DNA_END=454 /DNA_ORIENTATION=-